MIDLGKRGKAFQIIAREAAPLAINQRIYSRKANQTFIGLFSVRELKVIIPFSLFEKIRCLLERQANYSLIGMPMNSLAVVFLGQRCFH